MEYSDDRRNGNGVPRRITKSLWTKMLAAYRDRPTIGYVMKATGTGFKRSRRAIRQGWPEYGYPPFEEIVQVELGGANGTTGSIDPTTESTDLSAASGLAMSTAVTVARVTEQYAQQILEKLETDGIIVEGDLSPKIILELTKSVNVCNELLGRALKLQEMRSSQPESSTSRAIVELLDGCTDDELEAVITTGHPPDRLIHQGPPSTQRLLALLSSEREHVADNDDLEEDAKDALAEGLS